MVSKAAERSSSAPDAALAQAASQEAVAVITERLGHDPCWLGSEGVSESSIRSVLCQLRANMEATEMPLTFSSVFLRQVTLSR